jgi:hypothetical protein
MIVIFEQKKPCQTLFTQGFQVKVKDFFWYQCVRRMAKLKLTYYEKQYPYYSFVKCIIGECPELAGV